MYICIYRKPINKGFLTFRKQEYTDIQMKSIFRRRGEKGGECHMLAMTPKEKDGHRIRIWDTGNRRSKTVFNGYRKEMLIIWLQAPRCPSCFA